jgi:hypothetical protein
VWKQERPGISSRPFVLQGRACRPDPGRLWQRLREPGLDESGRFDAFCITRARILVRRRAWICKNLRNFSIPVAAK